MGCEAQNPARKGPAESLTEKNELDGGSAWSYLELYERDQLKVNGKVHALDIDPDDAASYVLSDDLGAERARSSAAGWASAAPARSS